MSATAHAAWLDAWEGASTPSPRAFRTTSSRTASPRYTKSSRTMSSRAFEQRDWDRAGSFATRDGEPSNDRHSIQQVRAVQDYDWEAAAKRRPARNECERVILHADRVVDARMSADRYYGREATARRPEPWPEVRRREVPPRLRMVKHKVPRWRLGVVAGIFAVLLIGMTIIAPIMTSSAVAGLESALGQAEAQQQQLAADTAALSSQISSLSSPQRVAQEAAALGLGPANDVSYLATGDQMLASEGDTTVAGR